MALLPHGNINSSIWLIGDSDPQNIKGLKYVFDSRHPVINNIWTPIIYKIQKRIYKEKGKIIDDEQFYVKNAITNPLYKPDVSADSWDARSIGPEKAEYLAREIDETKRLLSEHRPKMIITFGAFAYEFIRRCYGLPEYEFQHWDTKELKRKFIEAIKKKEDGAETIIPLLHASICGRHYLSSHKYFSGTVDNAGGNYFEFAAENLYPKINRIPALNGIVYNHFCNISLYFRASSRAFLAARPL